MQDYTLPLAFGYVFYLIVICLSYAYPLIKMKEAKLGMHCVCSWIAADLTTNIAASNLRYQSLMCESIFSFCFLSSSCKWIHWRMYSRPGSGYMISKSALHLSQCLDLNWRLKDFHSVETNNFAICTGCMVDMTHITDACQGKGHQYIFSSLIHLQACLSWLITRHQGMIWRVGSGFFW